MDGPNKKSELVVYHKPWSKPIKYQVRNGTRVPEPHTSRSPPRLDSLLLSYRLATAGLRGGPALPPGSGAHVLCAAIGREWGKPRDAPKTNLGPPVERVE